MFLSFVGRILYNIYFSIFFKKQKFYFSDFAHQINIVGIQAIPIIILLNFLVGVVLAHQGINTLNDYGQVDRIPDVFSPVYVRYVGCLITSLVIAGRSGSAFTAEIGSMKLNQEIEALRSMKIDPINIIVLPRFLATVIMMPFLITIAIISGIAGGIAISNFLIDLSPNLFLRTTQNIVNPITFYSTLIKSFIFGMIIACIGCYRGFCVRDNAQILGKMTTRSVVECIFYVIIIDGIISTYYAFLEI